MHGNLLTFLTATWEVAVGHYLDACDQVSNVYESEALMITYLELLVVLSAEFR